MENAEFTIVVCAAGIASTRFQGNRGQSGPGSCPVVFVLLAYRLALVSRVFVLHARLPYFSLEPHPTVGSAQVSEAQHEGEAQVQLQEADQDEEYGWNAVRHV